MPRQEAVVTFQTAFFDRPIYVQLKYNKRPVKALTTCVLVAEDGKVGVGVSACSALDVYDALKGAKLAYTRAIDGAEVPKDKRGQYWEAFFKRFPR